jgi:hypothetical protein
LIRCDVQGRGAKRPKDDERTFDDDPWLTKSSLVGAPQTSGKKPTWSTLPLHLLPEPDCFRILVSATVQTRLLLLT